MPLLQAAGGQWEPLDSAVTSVPHRETSLCSRPVTPVSELADQRENLPVKTPDQINSGITAYNIERKLLAVYRLRQFERRTASFRSSAVEIKQAREGTDS